MLIIPLSLSIFLQSLLSILFSFPSSIELQYAYIGLCAPLGLDRVDFSIIFVHHTPVHHTCEAPGATYCCVAHAPGATHMRHLVRRLFCDLYARLWVRGSAVWQTIEALGATRSCMIHMRGSGCYVLLCDMHVRLLVWCSDVYHECFLLPSAMWHTCEAPGAMSCSLKCLRSS